LDEKRRRALGALGAAVPVAALDGCAIFRPDPAELCERPGVEATPLLIDIHAHVFNGSDLQIADFIERLDKYLDSVWNEALKHIGGLLQRVAWHRAPWGPVEMRALARVQCGTLGLGFPLPRLREQAYAVAIDALDRAAIETQLAQAREGGRKAVFSPMAQDALDELKRTSYADYVAGRAARARSLDRVKGRGESLDPLFLHKSVQSLYDFVIQHFQYRYANVVEYFQKYEENGAQPVDLLVTSFLDFDHWISHGRKTPTSLREQMHVMERISVLTGGRVHSFVPFCPLRELETGGGSPGTKGESLAFVEEAIEQRGFIGVKIYPPMGFAPYGNAHAQNANAKLWHKMWLPKRTWEPTFGAELDLALRTFYDWCIERDVPVMAHTSRTNIMHEDFASLPGPGYWASALAERPGLRVNFGHIGGNEHDGGAPQAKDFVKLMATDAGGVHAYADIGYFFDAVDHPKGLQKSLGDAFKANKISYERMMYGSDYQMIVSEMGWGRYQREFRELIRGIGAEGRNLERDFFGGNAARYLGLHPRADGRPNNSSRLKAWYRRNNIPDPLWLRKLKRPATRAR
jgi:predicted TIM-barrel fold metal-dependent hydrolase